MTKLKEITILLLLFAITTVGCKSTKNVATKTKRVEGVAFVKSKTLTNVLEKAKAQDKLVFVDFYTSWCLPCKMMDEDVFPDQATGDFMNKNFISYKVNAEKGNGINLAQIFEVSAYPTLLFLDVNGRVLERKVGAAYHSELRKLGERAISTKVQASLESEK